MSSFFSQIKGIANFSNDIDIQKAENHIISSIDFKGANIWILIFAIVIASVGLNVNSIPVVIGAMLISPLMGPIMGIGLALGINDTVLLKRSFKNFLIMTIISIIASSLFFFISPLSLETPTELLARTNPTIYDVFIALFGGLAVIVEVCKREKGTVIAGAAIATALMPPLCTAGYGLASGKLVYFIGAFYLYFINSVFIALATFLMVRYMNFPFVKINDPVKQKKVHRIITIFTIVLIIPSIYSAIIIIKENTFNKNAKSFVEENKKFTNGYIYNYKIDHGAGKHSTLTIEIAGEQLSQKEIEGLHENLYKYDISPNQLVINQTSTYMPESLNDQDVVKGIFAQNEQEIKKREEYISQLENELKKLKEEQLPALQINKELCAQYPSIKQFYLAKGEKMSDSKNEEIILAIIKSNQRLGASEITKIKNWLSVRLNTQAIEIIQQ